MDPLVSLYYFAPVCAAFNLFLFLIFESKYLLMADLMRVGSTIFILNALVAFALNVSSLFLVGYFIPGWICVGINAYQTRSGKRHPWYLHFVVFSRISYLFVRRSSSLPPQSQGFNWSDIPSLW